MSVLEIGTNVLSPRMLYTTFIRGLLLVRDDFVNRRGFDVIDLIDEDALDVRRLLPVKAVRSLRLVDDEKLIFS